jgi:hypothetical protein
MKLSRQIALFAMIWSVVTAQCGHAAEPTIEAIRAQYARVTRELKRCTQVKRNLEGYSTEGGTLTAYFRNLSPRKLVAQFYGETGQATEEYYFWNNRLFFVIRRESRYDKPFGIVQSTTENRYYFTGGKLIRWVDERKNSISTASPKAQQREREMLRSTRELLELSKAAHKKRA